MLLPPLLLTLGSLVTACRAAEQLPLAPHASSTLELERRAREILSRDVLLDAHVDLPFVMRHLHAAPADGIADLSSALPGHIDIPRLREGGVGALFNIAYAPCDASAGDDFLGPTNSAEYAFESLDLVHRLVEQHPEELALALTAEDVRRNFRDGKISSLLGLEGSHHLMNSLSLLRAFADLGIRYLTLTHTCHNSFASSAGDGSPIEPAHERNGLTEFGRSLILELNRLGVMVDLSHTSDETMMDALDLTRAPVIFSHSGARSVHDHPRNVPDEILRRIGSGAGQNAGVVSVVFYPSFVDPARPTVQRVSDHIEHFVSIVGYDHVGLGSDFDGIHQSVEGLEDASKFPNLIVELLRRGWTEDQLAGLLGGNILRVMEAAERVKAELAGEKASAAIYERRVGHDMPVKWAGPGGEYLPEDVKRVVQGLAHDEL